MDPEAARTARESLDLVFHMSNILETGLDRHTLSILIALCEMGLNPEALAAVVKELRWETIPNLSSSASSLSATPPAPSIP
ncbi:mitotic-spindle organizing protein 1B-like [Coffea eugenioides]|uniref:mitotic-spindle organizing protein 1B-like n=1 Tax=Coffea eugenioides TaxID=49369 RepID=UPI000F6157B9|nr:mitotic-spindle organizing protein 1B-like [Coffea eugenioides]XP_027165253.1 mitotic-spindle organizing protein 1B-like [Coffea eugenioides]